MVNDTGNSPDPTGFWVLFATISASSMVFIGQSALNVALPTVQSTLGASGADLLWIVNIFALLLGALILVGGSLGDRYGRKRIYALGIAIFGLASLACGLAPNTELLIAARAVQGFGGALMVPGSLAIISAYFDGKARGQAIGTWSAFTTVTSILGPALGGVLADVGWWRGVFLVNLPLAVAALWALLRHVPESRDEEAPEQLDYLGAALVTLSLGGIVFGATEIGRVGPAGLGNPLYLGAILGGLGGLVWFVRHERRTPHPMLPLRLFLARNFTGANLLTLLLYGALSGALFFLPLNLVQFQGYNQTQAGLALLPWTLLIILLSRRMGTYVDEHGPRRPLILGPIIVGASMLLLAIPGVTNGFQDYWYAFLPALLLFGLGMGLVVAPLTTTVLGCVPRHNSGIASGINNAASRVASPLTVAILGSLALDLLQRGSAEPRGRPRVEPDRPGRAAASRPRLRQCATPFRSVSGAKSGGRKRHPGRLRRHFSPDDDHLGRAGLAGRPARRALPPGRDPCRSGPPGAGLTDFSRACSPALSDHIARPTAVRAAYVN